VSLLAAWRQKPSKTRRFLAANMTNGNKITRSERVPYLNTSSLANSFPKTPLLETPSQLVEDGRVDLAKIGMVLEVAHVEVG